MTFRIRVKQLREERSLSQYDLAEKLGVAQSTIGNWEAGKREPNYAMTIKIADFFGVSLDYLVGRTDEKTENIIKAPAKLADVGVESVTKSGSDELTAEEIKAIRRMLKKQE